RHRAAAVGAAHAAELRGIEDLRATGDRGDRHAGAERLRGGDEIGNDVVVFDREETTGSPHAALDFVGNHHDAVLRAPLADAAEESCRHRHEPGFALYRL